MVGRSSPVLHVPDGGLEHGLLLLQPRDGRVRIRQLLLQLRDRLQVPHTLRLMTTTTHDNPLTPLSLVLPSPPALPACLPLTSFVPTWNSAVSCLMTTYWSPKAEKSSLHDRDDDCPPHRPRTT